MSNPVKDFAFRYDGPIAAKEDRTCNMCNAVAAKKCPVPDNAHGTYKKGSAGCPACQAIEHGYCHNHGGLEKAINEHENIHDLTDPMKAAAWKEISNAVITLTKLSPPDLNIWIEVKWVYDENSKYKLKFDLDFHFYTP